MKLFIEILFLYNISPDYDRNILGENSYMQTILQREASLTLTWVFALILVVEPNTSGKMVGQNLKKNSQLNCLFFSEYFNEVLLLNSN